MHSPGPMWSAPPPAVPFNVQQGDAKALPAIAQSTPSQSKFPVQASVKKAPDSPVKKEQDSPVKEAANSSVQEAKDFPVEKVTDSPAKEVKDSPVKATDPKKNVT